MNTKTSWIDQLSGKVFIKTIISYKSIERVTTERCTLALGRTS